MNVQFRPSTIKDLPELCAFSRSIFFESFKESCSSKDMNTFLDIKYSVEQIRSELANPDSSFFSIYVDGTLSGYIKINEAPAQTDIHDAEALGLELLACAGLCREACGGLCSVRCAVNSVQCAACSERMWCV